MRSGPGPGRRTAIATLALAVFAALMRFAPTPALARPELTSSSPDGTDNRLVVNQALNTNARPGATDFTAKVNGAAITVSSANEDGTVSVTSVPGETRVEMKVNRVAKEDTVTSSYVQPDTNARQNSGGTKVDAAGLFAPVTGAPSSLPSDGSTLRSRVVTMDLERVRRARAVAASSRRPEHTGGAAAATRGAGTVPTSVTALTFNLFDDVVVTGRVVWTAPTLSGGYSVAGHLVEDPLGTMALVVNGETVAGAVRRSGKTYRIRSVGEGRYAISEVAAPPFICPVHGVPFGPDHRH